MSDIVLRKLKVIRGAFQGVRFGVDTWWEFFLFCMDHMISTFLRKNPRFYHKRKVKNFKGKDSYRIKDIRLPLLDEETEDTFFWQGPFGQTCFHYCYFGDCCDEATVERSHGATLFWRETPYAYMGDGLNVEILPSDVVIDAGSWIGDFAAYASAKGAGEVYAFEPSPPAFNYLMQTAKLNPNKKGWATWSRRSSCLWTPRMRSAIPSLTKTACVGMPSGFL